MSRDSQRRGAGRPLAVTAAPAVPVNNEGVPRHVVRLQQISERPRHIVGGPYPTPARSSRSERFTRPATSPRASGPARERWS